MVLRLLSSLAVRNVMECRCRVIWELFYLAFVCWSSSFFTFYLDIYKHRINKVYSSRLGTFLVDVDVAGRSRMENFISFIFNWIASRSGWMGELYYSATFFGFYFYFTF